MRLLSTSSPDVSKLTLICDGIRKSSSNTHYLTMNSTSISAKAKNSGSRKRTASSRSSKISAQILQRASVSKCSSRNAPTSLMSLLMSASCCCSWSNERALMRVLPLRMLTTQCKSRSKRRTATLRRRTRASWRGRPWNTRCPRRSGTTIGGGTSGSQGAARLAPKPNLPLALLPPCSLG